MKRAGLVPSTGQCGVRETTASEDPVQALLDTTSQEESAPAGIEPATPGLGNHCHASLARSPHPELVSPAMADRDADLKDTVGRYLSQWLSHVRGRVRGRTWQGYEGLIRLYALPSIGDLNLVALQPLDLQHLYSRLLEREVRQLSAGTILNLHLVLHQAFGQAVRWGMIASNPVDGAQPPRPRRPEFTAIDTALVERILADLQGHPIELAVAIAVATGMRRGEICGLRWGDLDENLMVAQVRRTCRSLGRT